MKRFIALFLALTMILSLCPVTALAEELPAEADISVEENIIDSGEEEILEETNLQELSLVQSEMASYSISEEDLGYTDDEAFAAYVQREFDEALGIEVPAMWSTSVLEDGTYGAIIYEKLKPMLSATANGEVETTEFEVSLDSPIWTTADELSLFYDDLALVFNCLLADCPLELYWCDKTSVQYSPIWENHDDDCKVIGAYFGLLVSADYSASGETDTYAVDTDKTGATSNAVENAVAIVDEHASKGNYAKLEAYRDEICYLVDYNDAAADDATNTPYGDPWQMIWVFDKDPATKVVCEGYSKAFQYLCDSSEFETNEDTNYPPYPIECHTVYGDVDFGGGDGGPHMWNVVTMDDGNNYLVDVTNCDMGSYGDDSLFIVPTDDDYWYTAIKYSDGTEDECLSYSTAIGYNYIYSPEIETLFGDACYLSQTAYEAPTEPAVEAQWGIAGMNGAKPTQWESGTLFEAVSYANELSSGTAYIQLIADVETDYGYYFWEDTTTILDLNGHTIDRNLTEATDGGTVLNVWGELTLCDSSTTVVANQGKITGGYSTNAAAGGVVVSGTFIMEGGRITRNSGQYAGGVAVFPEATFTMNGGMISENTTTGWYDGDYLYDGYGGGVYVGGSFTMTDGTISKNDAVQGGGGVVVMSNGTFTMEGGMISQNTTSGYDLNGIEITGYGGGVDVVGGSFTMTDGEISGNTANYGGGVNVGDVYVMGDNGETPFFGTFTMDGGNIYANVATGNGGGVHINKTMKVSGAAVINGNTVNGLANNVLLVLDSSILVSGALTGDASIGVTASAMDNYTEPTTVATGSNYTLTQTDVDKFFSDDDYIVKLDSTNNAVLFEKPEEPPVLPALTGTSTLNPADVMLFNDLNDTKLSFNGSNVFAMYEDVYFVCDEAASYTLYLAEPSWYTDTFAVTDGDGNPVPLEMVGTMTVSGGLGTVYALKVDKPASGEEQTVFYNMTRSWKYQNDNSELITTEVEFTLTFDFTPVFTVKSGAGTDKIKIFSKLDTRKDELSNDGSISFHDGFLISAGGKSETIAYLAVAATDALAVSYASSHGDVPMEHVGTYIEGIPHCVYAITAAPPANGNGFTVYSATCWYRDDQQMPSTGGNMTGMPAQTIRLICDFYLKPGDTVPMTHNGLRIYGIYEDGKLGYLNLDSFDEMAYNDTVNAVQVPCRPNQDKSIYLVSSEPLSLDSNEENASLTICEDADVTSGYTAYRLTVNGQGSDYRVSVSNGTKTTAFDFWFSSVVLNRTSFYTTTDDYVNFGYENPVTCDGLSVEDFYGDLVLKVPYTIGKAKTLFFVTDDGDITDVTISGGGLEKMCTRFRGYNGDEPLNIYGLTLSEKTATTGNVILALWKKDDNGKQYEYAFTNILFEPYAVELGTDAFNFDVNLFADAEELTFGLGESLYDITRAEFENEKLNNAFGILLSEDGSRLTIEPRFPADGDWVAWGKACAGTHKSVIKLYYGNGDEQYCTTEELTFKLTATMPKVTAKAVKFNSFYENQESVLELIPANGAGISGVEWGDNELDWIEKEIFYPSDVHEGSINNKFFLKLNSDSEELEGGKVSGKLNLEVYVKGYRAPIPVTVSVSAASTAPKMKLSESSVTFVGTKEYEEEKNLQLFFSDGSDIAAVNDVIVDAGAPYEVSYNESKNGTFTLIPTDDIEKGGKITLLVDINGAAEYVSVPLTVKVVKPTVKASTTKVTLNTVMGTGELRDVWSITFNGKDLPKDWLTPDKITWDVAYAKGDAPYENELDISVDKNGVMTIAANEDIEKQNFKVTVTVGAAKPVVINVTGKATIPKLKLSAKSVTINRAMGFNGGLSNDMQNLEISSGNDLYDLIGFGANCQISIEPPVEGAGLWYQMVNNQLSFAAYALEEDNPTCPGTYKVTIKNTLPNEKEVEATLTVKVIDKLPTVKLKTSSISLDVEKGIATIDVTGLEGFALHDEEHFTAQVACGKNPESDAVDIIENEFGDLVVTLDEAVVGQTYKVSISYNLDCTDEAGNPIKTKPVTLTVKAVEGITASATAKGNMDMTRPESTSTKFTFKYTGWYDGIHMYDPVRLPTLYWEVYANGTQGVITGEQGTIHNNENGLVAAGGVGRINGLHDESCWFKNVSTAPYGVELQINTDSEAWANGKINPKYTYTVAFKLVFDNGDEDPANDYTYIFPKTVKMTVKQGSAKFAIAIPNGAKAVTLDKVNDASSVFAINGTDKDADNVAKIAKVEVVKGRDILSNAVTVVRNEETGSCTLVWSGEADRGAAKSGSVKLNIWLEGNYEADYDTSLGTKDPGYRKPNATVSLKVTVTDVTSAMTG